MNDLFLALFLLSPICLIAGLIKPSLFNKIFRGNATRKYTAGTFVISTLVFFVLFAATMPDKVVENTEPVVQHVPRQISTTTATPTHAPVVTKQDAPVPVKAPVKTVTPIVQPTAPVVQSAPPAPKPIIPAKPTAPSFGNGNFVVGTDIQPGTYRTRVGSSGCYYSRLSGFSGAIGDILSNDNTDDPAVITILSSDKGFKSVRCGTWTQDLSQITSSQTSFGGGTYIVGTDMLPGTYRSSGEGSCYYSRLSGFGGAMGDILANENTDASAIVSIASTDKGFKSVRCGTWTKIN